MAFGDLLALLRMPGHFFGVTQFFVARLFLVLQPLVFRFPACPQIWATVGQQRAESLSGGELFGVVSRVPVNSQDESRPWCSQAAALRSMSSAILRFRRSSANQPTRCIPLAQQAFQRDLDDDLSVALIAHQQPLCHEGIDELVGCSRGRSDSRATRRNA